MDGGITTDEAFGELKELLMRAASDASPPRSSITRYTACRDVLLRSHLQSDLPGFLHQCLTLDRFRLFIHLYSPDTRLREVFVDAALRRCEARYGIRSTFDVFAGRDAAEPDF